MQIQQQIVFGDLERQLLERAALHVRIAFPTEGVNLADKKQWREYGGRHLMTFLTNSHEPRTYAQIEAALTALETLELELEAQSDPDYWRQHLSAGDLPPRITHGIALIAPDHDVVPHLAEIRQGQLRDAQEAKPILLEAKRRLGGPDDEADLDAEDDAA